MLELTRNGREPVSLAAGEQRGFSRMAMRLCFADFASGMGLWGLGWGSAGNDCKLVVESEADFAKLSMHHEASTLQAKGRDQWLISGGTPLFCFDR